MRAYDIELPVSAALLESATAFPRKRGRPSRAVVNFYSLAEVIPLLNSVQARALIRGVVNEVIWNADTGGIRIKLSWERWPVMCANCCTKKPDPSAVQNFGR